MRYTHQCLCQSFEEKVKFFGLDGYPIVSTDFVGDVIIDRSKYRVYLVKATCLPHTYLTEYEGVRIGIKHTWDKDPKKIEIFFRKYTKLYGTARHDVYHAQFDINGQYINDKVNPYLFTQEAINEFSRFIKENRELFLKPQPSIREGMRLEFDEFGGLRLVLKDGDYMTVRMDGKVVSFMGIPFENLNTYETAEVARVKAQYRKDWYNTLY